MTKEQKAKVALMAQVHNQHDVHDNAPYVNVQCHTTVSSAIAVCGATVEEVKALTTEELNYFAFLTFQDPYMQLNNGSVSLKHTDWDEFLDIMEEV